MEGLAAKEYVEKLSQKLNYNDKVDLLGVDEELKVVVEEGRRELDANKSQIMQDLLNTCLSYDEKGCKSEKMKIKYEEIWNQLYSEEYIKNTYVKTISHGNVTNHQDYLRYKQKRASAKIVQAQ